MQSRLAAYYVFGPPPGGFAQVSQDVGYHRGKVQKETSQLEASIYIQRGKSYTYQKHSVESPYLFYVAFPDLESRVQKVRKNPEGLSVGRGEPGKEASFGELGHGVYR